MILECESVLRVREMERVCCDQDALGRLVCMMRGVWHDALFMDLQRLSRLPWGAGGYSASVASGEGMVAGRNGECAHTVEW